MTHAYRLLIEFAFYQILAVSIFRKIVFDKTHTFLSWSDASDQSYAWLLKVWHALGHGQLALWDFGVFGGTTFVGELQTAPFYPLALLYAPFGQGFDPRCVDIFLVIHFGIAAFLMHEFLRELKLSLPARLIGATIFAFVGAVAMRAMSQPNIFCGAIYMPGAALFALKALSAQSRLGIAKWSAVCGLTLGMAILAGHVHTYIHIVVCVGLILFATLFIGQKVSIRKSASIGAIAGGVSLIFTAVQLLPTQEFLKLAYKWGNSGVTRYPHIAPYADFVSLSMTKQSLCTLFGRFNDQWPHGPDTLYITISGLLLCAASLISFRQYGTRLGWLIVALFLLLAFAGTTPLGQLIFQIPILNLVRAPSRALHIYIFGAALLAASGADALCSLLPKMKEKLSFALVAFVLAEAVLYAQGIPVPAERETTPHIAVLRNPLLNVLLDHTTKDGNQYRYYPLPSRPVEPNLGDLYPVFGIMGHRGAMLIKYNELVSHDYRANSRGMDQFSVKYVLSKEPIAGLHEDWTNGLLHFYVRPNPLPMFCYLDSTGKEHHEQVCLPKWQTNSVSLQLTKPLNGDLIFSQVSYPGWNVYVDGQRRELSEHNSFMSVALKEADKNVEFAYEPAFLWPCLALSILTCIGTAALFVLDRRDCQTVS